MAVNSSRAGTILQLKWKLFGKYSKYSIIASCNNSLPSLFTQKCRNHGGGYLKTTFSCNSILLATFEKPPSSHLKPDEICVRKSKRTQPTVKPLHLLIMGTVSKESPTMLRILPLRPLSRNFHKCRIKPGYEKRLMWALSLNTDVILDWNNVARW